MPRPTTRDELLRASAAGLDQVWAAADALPPGTRWEDPEDRDHDVRDVLAHLVEWQLMMLGWYTEGMAGGRPHTPATGHTWRTLPALNAEIWDRYQGTDEDVVRATLTQTHDRLMTIIASHSDAELFEKKRYPWTGTTSLGAYLVSATSSHYAWAVRTLRRRRPAGRGAPA